MMVQPFLILELIYVIGILNGFSTHTLLYLILLGAGVGMRLLVKRQRDFWCFAGVSAALYAVCEVIVDFDDVWHISWSLYSTAYTIGTVCFCFAAGLLLCALICRILRRKQLH